MPRVLVLGATILGALTAGSCALPAFAASPSPAAAAALSAERDLQAARTEGSSAPLLGLGLMQLRSGATTEAMTTLRQALELYRGGPAEPAALLHLGRAFAELRERSLAEESFRLLLERFPLDPLADDAAWETARLDARHLLDAERIRSVFDDFPFQDPLGLDFDALAWLVGMDQGFRLDGIDRALAALRKVWTGWPAGDRAPDALMAEAVNRAFLLGRPDEGHELLAAVRTRYPGSAHVGLSLVADAFLEAAAGRFDEALALLDAVEPGETVTATSAFLAGWICAWRLDDPRRGLVYLGAMERHAPDDRWLSAALYHQAMVQFTLLHAFPDARTRLERAVELVRPLTDPSSRVILTAATYLLETTRSIESETDVARARLRYAVYFQATGHPDRAAREFRDVLGTAQDPALVARLSYELGVTLGDDLLDPDGARQALEQAASADALSADRAAEARFRLAALDPGPPGAESLAAIATGTDVWGPSATREVARRGAVSETLRRQVLAPELAGGEGDDEPRAAILRGLAEMFERDGALAQALECYGRLYAVWPPAAEAIERLERRLSLAHLSRTLGDDGGDTDDPTLLLEMARLEGIQGHREAALKLLRRAERAARGTSSEDAVALALLQATLPSARSTAHRLTLVEDFLTAHPGRTAEALEGLALRAGLLETRAGEFRDDVTAANKAEDEAAGIWRYLLERGVQTALAAERLARRAVRDEKFTEALGALRQGTAASSAPPSLLMLLAEVLGKTGAVDERRDVLTRLATDHAATTEGRSAVTLLRQERQAALEDTLRNLTKPALVAHRLSAFLQTADTEDATAARGLLERMARRLEEETAATPELLTLLGRALAAAGGGARGAVLLRQAAEAAEGPDAVDLVVEAARAQADAGDKEGAFALLRDRGGDAPAARLATARLLATGYRDPAKARPILTELLAETDCPPPILTDAVLAAVDLVPPAGDGTDAARTAKDAALERVALLTGAAPRLTGPLRFRILEKLGAAEEAAERPERAVAVWTEAATLAPAPDDAARCSRRAIEAMVANKQFDRARDELNRLLAAGVPEAERESLRSLLRQTAAREQLATLRRTLNWDDPEGRGNFETLMRMANLYVEPLGDLRRAEAVLNQASELFPRQKGHPSVTALRARIPLLRRLAESEAAARDDAGVFRLARTCEEEAREPSRAAALYARLVERWPGSPYVPGALMYLIRLESLVLDRPDAADAHLRTLLGHPAAGRLAPRLVAFVNLAASREKLGRLRARAEAGTATPGELRELGEAAARDVADPATVRLAIDRLAAAPGGKPAALALALTAAGALRPQGLLVPGGAQAEGFLRRALELASTGDERARVHLMLGSLLAAADSPRQGHDHFTRAIAAAPASLEAREALFRTAELLETSLDRPQEALATYRRLAGGGGDERVVQVASTRAERLAQRLAVKGMLDEAESQAVEKKSPILYFYTGRRLAKETEDLESALAAFRTYIRLGDQPPLVIGAQQAAADLLIRLGRPAEALAELERMMVAQPELVDREEVQLTMAGIRETAMADLDGAARLYRLVADSRSPRSAEGTAGLARVERLRKELTTAQRVGLSAEAASRDVVRIRQEFLSGRRKDWRGATDALREELEGTKDPAARAPLLLELGSILDNEEKRYDEALEAYDDYLKVTTDARRAADVQLRRGDILAVELKRPDEALEAYESFLKRNGGHPRRVEVLLKVAELKEKALDRVQEALDAYRVIADSYPRSGWDEKALMHLASLQRTYYADFQAALEAYRRIIERFPYGEFADDAQYDIARIYEIELGDLVQAKAEYEKLLATYPTSPFTGAARDALIRIERR